MSNTRKIKMTYLRKAWSLTEMFYIMALLGVLLLLMTGPTRTIIRRVPHIQADIQTNRILLSVLDSIRKDVAMAVDIEVAVTEIPAEIQKIVKPPLIDPDFEQNIPPLPIEPNEPNEPNELIIPVEPNEPNGLTEPMEIKLSISEASYYSTDVFSDSNSMNITNEPNITEVVNDANLLIMPVDANEVNSEKLARPSEPNRVYIIPGYTITSLVVKTDTKTIRYEFSRGIAKRIGPTAEQPTVWHIPKARLDMRVWKENEKAYALEIATAIVRRINGRTRDSMSNSHVFFVKEQTR
jgi:hypothetical protein